MYITKQGGKMDYNLKEIFLDDASELGSVSTNITSPGSVAYIIATGDVYILNSEKKWIKQDGESGGPTLILQKDKEVTYTANGSYEITPDVAYDGLENALVTVNVTPNLQDKNVTITSNTTTTIQKDSEYDGLGTVSVTTNIPSRIKMDLTDVKFMQSPFTTFPTGLVENGDWEHLTSAYQMFFACENLTAIPSNLDLSHVENVSEMFYSCNELVDIPALNISSATTIQNMFYGLQQTPMKAESIDNVLKICISATSFTGTKTLSHIGIKSWYYPSSYVQNLPSYQDFIDAGWTIGY